MLISCGKSPFIVTRVVNYVSDIFDVNKIWLGLVVDRDLWIDELVEAGLFSWEFVSQSGPD